MGVDVGGTCTDSVVVDESGVTVVAKAFSTPPEFSAGILDSLTVAAGELALSIEELLGATWLFLHGTTVAENAIADGRLDPVGLITTSGFRDTLFATRGGFGRWSGLSEEEKRNPVETFKPPPLVPVDRIRTVKERVDRDGNVVVALREDDIEQAISELLSKGSTGIAVCLLWSFLHPEHELAIGEAISRVRSDVFVSLSHELAPVVGEYERTSTVALNVSLGPAVRPTLRPSVNASRSTVSGAVLW